MDYKGKAQLQYASHRVIGAGQAVLHDVADDPAVEWKGTLTLEEVDDDTFLDGKTGQGFELKLLDCPETPRVPATVRHIERVTVGLAGSTPLPECS